MQCVIFSHGLRIKLSFDRSYCVRLLVEKHLHILLSLSLPPVRMHTKFIAIYLRYQLKSLQIV